MIMSKGVVCGGVCVRVCGYMHVETHASLSFIPFLLFKGFTTTTNIPKQATHHITSALSSPPRPVPGLQRLQRTSLEASNFLEE